MVKSRKQRNDQGGCARPAALGGLSSLVVLVIYQSRLQDSLLPDLQVHVDALVGSQSETQQPPAHTRTVAATSQSTVQQITVQQQRHQLEPQPQQNKPQQQQLQPKHTPQVQTTATENTPVTQNIPSSAAASTEEERHLLQVVQKRKGLYVDKSAHPVFSDVILLTGANYAYFKVYNNWRCNAEKHGLDWAVIANDDQAQANLESDRALPVLGEKVSGMNGWGSAKLDSVGRNKMFMVLTIMKLAGLGVVFSDADNMFRGDLFAEGVHLGDLIRSGKHDYVYQEELSKAPEKGHVVPGDGGNTGFFYATPKRKPKMLTFFAAVVDEVDRQREESFRKNGERLGADQPIFWQIMQKLRATGGKPGPGGFKCVHLCNQNPTCKAAEEDTMDYCSMDAFTHPTGWEKCPKTAVTYHANYAANEDKIAKLEKAGLWNAWLEKSGKCAVERQAAAAAPSTQTSNSGQPDPSSALACLRLSTPSLKPLAYPNDAEAHFEEVREALTPWFDFAEKQFMKDMKNPYHCGEGYCGPWIENKWIALYYTKLWKGRAAGTRLADIFGPYIPIFMTFVDLWIANVFEYENMIDALKKVIRPSVAYITVVQHDTGMPSSRDKLVGLMKQIPNVLVLSAGGYGHVPIPLFKQYEDLLKKKFLKSMGDRQLLTSYMGSEGNAPKDTAEL
eukprot:TRINITY_DN6482_c0_g1_i4.p1 TRINITY_DN6482_c0_g1~~TRINITY_DN6482_c0_g1_i4.p1  ORF type:complete len:674 (-),score=149.64 TRINITY_DN6482_c0_g1_i4:88-2109(-)